MAENPLHELPTALIALMLVCALLLALFASNALGRRTATRQPKQLELGPLETMASGLLGLLLAFNFSIAQSRFDARQEMLVREADAIGTAYLRCSVLAEDDRRSCREKFRQYVALRIETYAVYKSGARNTDELRRKLDEGEHLQHQLWTIVAGAVRQSPDPPHTALMTALNSVIDLDSDRRASLRIQVPIIVSVVIALSCIAWAVLLGYSSGLNGSGSRTAWVVVSVLISLVFGVAMDFDRPRSGFITTSAAEVAMTNVANSINMPPVD
ncbi:hypothetical protein AKJ09_00260 [Labilithrix luteola]|uniref:DUF4239 domain-containing protein n=1 Tax=Labilithrix luteola TaxID=1391654 RepID=A0A0K1PJK4_9BACT|nr:hypothetical protein [Labilithrix luteola]AKU93596.1 hypothetical protein AKJ09_00260 [Labilithrix luteola]